MPKKKLIKPTKKGLAATKKKERESKGKKSKPTTIQPTAEGIAAAKKKELAKKKKKVVKKKVRKSI